MNDTVDIVAISRALTTRRLQSAGDGPMGRAAVAIILQETAEDGVSVLIIERARHDGDPWSGALAFPGGRLEPGEDFEYTSGCPLATPFGSMEGTFQMGTEDEDGGFDAEVARFELREPHAVH